MAFGFLMLTTSGQTLYAKAQQGKKLRFTRMALGDGLLGTGSMINRTALIHEVLSLKIDAVIRLGNEASEAAFIATLTNNDLTGGFSFRELAIMAEDPDTHQELAYAYDYAGEDAEFIPSPDSGVKVFERLKLLLKLENTPYVTFEASGNPLYATIEDIQAHERTSTDSNDGVHGLRVHNGILQYKSGEDTWDDIASEIVSEETIQKMIDKTYVPSSMSGGSSDSEKG